MKPGTSRATNPHLLTGAHALGALPAAERAEFEAHLSRCPSCADEVAELAGTVARLGNAVHHIAPGDLRPQVLQAIRRARQVPSALQFGRVFSRREGFRRAAALVSAACVVAAAVAGAHAALTPPTTTSVAPAPRSEIGALLAAPDLRLVTTPAEVGTAAVSRSRDQLLFLAGDLPALSSDRVYQLWLVDHRGPRPVALLRQPGAVALVTGVAEAAEVMLTVEPDGGSPSPTGSPVLTVALR